MAEVKITAESDPERYAAMMAQWSREKYPGYLVLSQQTYRAVQVVGGQIEFWEQDHRNMYESTGF